MADERKGQYDVDFTDAELDVISDFTEGRCRPERARTWRST